MKYMLDAKQKGSGTPAMNKLDRKTRAQILHLLCEGQSIRAVTPPDRVQQEHRGEAAG
jgi:hypothetical protein